MKIKYIEVSKISDNRWSLSFFEANNEIPFDIKRVYYIYDLKKDWSIRWKHSHIKTNQVLFCINWSMDIIFDNWQEKKIIRLDKPNKGVFIPNMTWHYMENFTNNCILLIVASDIYNEADYIRNYKEFINNLK